MVVVPPLDNTADAAVAVPPTDAEDTVMAPETVLVVLHPLELVTTQKYYVVPATAVDGVYEFVVNEPTVVEINVPPLVELLVLLYHLYLAISPLLAAAVTVKLVGVPLIQTDWVDADG